MRPGLEPWALGFLDLEPGPSLLKARAKPYLRPGLRGPGRARLRALSPARHITTSRFLLHFLGISKFPV
jgi:hypothetical protein